MVDRLEALIQRLENAVARQEALAGGASPAKAAGPVQNKLAKEFIAEVQPKVAALRERTANLGIAQVTKATD